MSKFFILVPIYNFQYFIDICIRSILFQSYTNWYCILFDDGSTDKSKIMCNYYVKKYPNKFKYIKLDNKNNGGGYSKWYGIQEIKKLCNDNDIMIIIDGDDYLINKNALSIIHKRYLNTNCWGTFGSYEGKYSDMKHKVNMNNYSRKNWFFLAPRTCKCFLLKLFTINDFKYENKEWLQKSTDVAFFCNIVEWSGIHNIQYIKDILYKYREHNRNGYKIMNPSMKKHKAYVCNLKEKDKYFYNLISNIDYNPDIYWENRYKKKGNSGTGSYNNLAVFKSDVINNFIKDNKICNMIDYGMGDGNQLKYFKIKNYIGLDVSKTIVSKCKSIYKNDKNKCFYLVEEYNKNNKQELVISLDVLLHLVPDKFYFNYLNNLFNMSSNYVIIYSYNANYQSADHVKYREFIPYILNNYKKIK